MIEISALELPESADEQSTTGEVFRAVSSLVDRCSEAVYGAGSTTLNHALALRLRRGTSAEAVDTLVAFAGDAPVGVADIFLPQTESTATADTMLFVEPELPLERRAEIFERLVAACIAHADEIGRTTVLGGGLGGATGAVMAQTGFGGVDRDDPESAAWLRRGATLSQVYRFSRLQLDRLHDLDARLAAAAASADGYRALTWTGETPADRRADMRHLHERMSTDSPVGDLELEEQSWSDARLTEFEQHKMGGERQLLTAAVEHVASGRLVGYTQMMIGADAVARQHNLIVLREHRGHGLGMLMKLAGIELLQRAAPHAARITTINAEENRHMLRVNEAVGFMPVAWTAVWQLKSADTTMDS